MSRYNSHRHVKNLTRGGEGKLPVDTLLRMLGDAGRSPSIKSGGGLMVSELYRPNDFIRILYSKMQLT